MVIVHGTCTVDATLMPFGLILGPNCDLAAEVSGQGSVPAGRLCDRPKLPTKQCDPGSKFQVLATSPDAEVVAHSLGSIALGNRNRLKPV